MVFDDALQRYFGTEEIDKLESGSLSAGIERIRVDFGMETDGGRRFGLWTLLYMLGAAPDLDAAFADPADREAARNFMDMIDQVD